LMVLRALAIPPEDSMKKAEYGERTQTAV